MSDTIDLDLVELRCKIRGWHCERRAGLKPEVRIATPDGGVWLAADGTRGGVSMYARDERGISRPLAAPALYPDCCEHADMLLSPRWTLDRLLSDPPEGWTAHHHGWDGLVLEYTAPGNTVVIKAGPRPAHTHGGYGADSPLSPRAPEVWGLDDVRDVAVHLDLVHAVAGMLLILAEVEP